MSIPQAECDLRPGSRSCSAWYIAGRGGFRERSPAWILRQIRAWIDKAGFPPPIILFDCGPGRKPVKVDELTTRARWNLEAVDLWFTGQPSAALPAQVLESASAALAAHYAAALDGRAVGLGRKS
ncbi:MAG: hypothetical protein QOG72_2431 [Sphingomonadales bacterium]|jgi:hypothetical protein|nr:hypothetical protein [Sphingomonadales bacterium]